MRKFLALLCCILASPIAFAVGPITGGNTGGGTPPTGTGFRHVTSGSEDGAAALVTDADISAAAAIARSKLNFADTPLAGGTSLTPGTIYHDTLTAGRTLTFSGSPSSALPPTVLRLTVTGGPWTLVYPSSYSVNGNGTSQTSSVLPTGRYEISWIYADGVFWVAGLPGPPAQTGDGGDALVAFGIMSGTPTWRSSAVTASATNDSATAGYIGEEIHAYLPIGSAVTLTTATAANIRSIALTAGDWDVRAVMHHSMAGVTTTATTQAGISQTSGTLPTDGTEAYSGVKGGAGTIIDDLSIPSLRISLSGSTTVYLVGKSTFSAGTVTAFGGISARRTR